MSRIFVPVIAFFFLSTTLSFSQATDRDAAAQANAARIAVSTCAGCHGASGVSAVPKFPVLAAQSANYLVSQLKAFKSRTRGDPDALAFMWGIAASLDDAQISALAEYYSSRRAYSGSGTPNAASVYMRVPSDTSFAAVDPVRMVARHGRRAPVGFIDGHNEMMRPSETGMQFPKGNPAALWDKL